ncbi:helix-turn-helix transcriptional regulator [Mycobacteroides chelonae]|uniref:helix-turn-helix domain-containing protein n=1 Tax=Mycobacteroides chelonae TaxID=1774 RepID=UPI00095A2D45|nr:helix-turn-helix transcriptional regulator [Mycobacteroides chelonae]MEC4841263.1 helix-turn-helix transcriptional regulator [Mycobacteroides chelonae]MEC4845697.1 helix-turn-helix transcriptional regulator [Mycobacteroides chelonae]MEC4854787.1 helix-turn-helix transcriptional regulator [Mycobacteroides chelonae]MEC4869352.1 helix-turn-helix transcriptional regulator [Mycobacteroides chelonae]OLT79061.1 hypothetical protein BKG57_14670 [Mycobacteroides chelonae]
MQHALERAKPVSALASFLRSQLESRGWTQSELARRCGLSRQHVSRLLTRQSVIVRRRLPSDETFAKLADGLGIPEVMLRQSISFPEKRSADFVRRKVTG